MEHGILLFRATIREKPWPDTNFFLFLNSLLRHCHTINLMKFSLNDVDFTMHMSTACGWDETSIAAMWCPEPSWPAPRIGFLREVTQTRTDIREDRRRSNPFRFLYLVINLVEDVYNIIVHYFNIPHPRSYLFVFAISRFPHLYLIKMCLTRGFLKEENILCHISR